jgi:hypothetical protein
MKTTIDPSNPGDQTARCFPLQVAALSTALAGSVAYHLDVLCTLLMFGGSGLVAFEGLLIKLLAAAFDAPSAKVSGVDHGVNCFGHVRSGAWSRGVVLDVLVLGCLELLAPSLSEASD